MEYWCHVWAGTPNCYLKLLDKLQKWMCRTVGPSLAASLEPLAHCQNVASLSLFYRYYFGRCSSEMAELVPLPYSQGRSVTIPRCYKDVYEMGMEFSEMGGLFLKWGVLAPQRTMEHLNDYSFLISWQLCFKKHSAK